tara:strand:- start:546 stop:950 length:405 start_codon:yes stop_codon:yes gene_type:complete
MANITLNFGVGTLNISVQVGDTLWLAPLSGRNQHGTNNPSLKAEKMTKLGVVAPGGVNRLLGRVTYIPEPGSPQTDAELDEMINTDDSYFFFAKDQRANTSGILGYYASIEYKNYTKRSAEIFAVGTNYAPSSK